MLPCNLEMILKTYYHLPAHQALVTSLVVQLNDIMGLHRDGEHNPLERSRASEEKEKVVADGTSSIDQEGDFFSKSRLGWTTRHQTSPVAISNWRCFVIIKGQQRKAQIGGETNSFKYTSRETPKIATAARVAAREEAAISRHQRGASSTEQNKQFEPEERRVNCSFLPSGYAALCVFSFAFSVLPFCKFPSLSYQVQRQQELLTEDVSARKQEEQLLI